MEQSQDRSQADVPAHEAETSSSFNPDGNPPSKPRGMRAVGPKHCTYFAHLPMPIDITNVRNWGSNLLPHLPGTERH